MPVPMNGLIMPQSKEPGLLDQENSISTLASSTSEASTQPAESQQSIEESQTGDTLSTIALQPPADAFIDDKPTTKTEAVVDQREKVDGVTTIATSSPDPDTRAAATEENEFITGINTASGVTTIVKEPAQ